MNAKSTQDGANHGETSLLISDDVIPDYKIYVYNITKEAYIRRLPPNFPGVIIPACIPGEKFSFTTLPPTVRNRFTKPGTFEYYYQVEDGRKSASQLLNPACFPGINWERQLVPNNAAMDEQTGNNLNEFGVWWSLTRPQDTEQLDKEIKLFHEILTRKMRALAGLARQWGSDPKKVHEITPRMHAAMDFLGLKAPWHTDTYAIVNCPTCGEEVRDGVVYHRNSMGDRCIVDLERAQKMGIAPPPEIVGKPEPVAPRMVSSDPFEATEIRPQHTEEENREQEDLVLAHAERIRTERQQAAAAKRAATIAAKKKALHSDPTASTQDVNAAVDDEAKEEGKE